ncbi:MAG: hypothetical protein H6618_09970 [Deltaproteobacteria bacterium]|nr:hypothetical protein [Deltaproteobacteria bacterium]
MEEKAAAESEANTNILPEESSSAKKKHKSQASQLTKTRCVISSSADHPFCQFMNQLRDRGVRQFDPGEFIGEILDSMSDQFWKEQLEKRTPLEFRINAALADPNMREKLTTLLAAETALPGEKDSMQ